MMVGLGKDEEVVIQTYQGRLCITTSEKFAVTVEGDGGIGS
jgi:hypothetical protein